MLDLPRHKENDTLRIEFPQVETAKQNKRGVLSTLAKLYDHLGLVSPTTLSGKLIFREISDEKLAWDTELPDPLQVSWNKRYANLPASVTFPRSITPYQQPIQKVDLHAFGDASAKGVCSVVYAVVKQKGRAAKNIVTAKARIDSQTGTNNTKLRTGGQSHGRQPDSQCSTSNSTCHYSRPPLLARQYSGVVLDPGYRGVQAVRLSHGTISPAWRTPLTWEATEGAW